MKLIDMHCDTLWKLLDERCEGGFDSGSCDVTLEKMRGGGSLAQFFACFTFREDYSKWENPYDGAYEHVMRMLDRLDLEVQRHSDVIAKAGAGAGSVADEILNHRSEGRMTAVATVEEGGVLCGRMERLDALYERGVRAMTLLWNFENCIGAPNSRDPELMKRGLTDFGFDVVARMNELGMLVDLSHASDGVFWDVLGTSSKPVIATHSNCRALCDHPRNLTDEMIRAMAEKGGVSGLNFYGRFLNGQEESRLEDMVAHALHMIRVGGIEFAAIGTDFDGFDGMEYMEIADISGMELLWDALRRSGLGENQLDKIWNGNALRVLQGC